MLGLRGLLLVGLVVAVLFTTGTSHRASAPSPGIRIAARGVASTLGTWIVPSSARSAGEGGAIWRTDLALANLADEPADTVVRFLGHDEDGRSGPEVAVALAAGEAKVFVDVLGTLFGVDTGFGALRVTSSTSWLDVSAETSTASDAGSIGQVVPGFAAESWAGPGETFLFAPVTENSAFRTNLVLANAAEVAATVRVVLRAAGNEVLSTRSLVLPPLGMTQLARVASGLGVPGIAGARLEVTATSPGAALAAYAAAIDNATNDPATLLPLRPTSRLLPACARIPGERGSFWTTDLTVGNTSAARVRFRLRLLPGGADGLTGLERILEVGPSSTVTFDDVVRRVFGLESGYGALRVTGAEASLTLAARTSTRTASGTFGQSVPGAASRDLAVPGAPLAITGVREDSAFRTNLVLANATFAACDVDVELLGADGSPLGSDRVRLPPAGMTQLPHVARALGFPEELAYGRLKLSTRTPGGAFGTHAVKIDAGTGDPRTLLPVPGPPLAAGSVLAVVNGTLFDGTGAPPVPDAVVLVRDGRVAAAGPRARVRVPAGARILDAAGGTILPGVINAHVHGAYDVARLTRWARAGVTTVRDLHVSPGSLDAAFAIRDRTLVDPSLARIVSVGSMLTVPGGYPAYWGGRGIEVTSAAHARSEALSLVDRGADLLKIPIESGIGFGQPWWPMLDAAEVAAIRQVARERGTLVSVHVLVTQDLARALDWGADDIAHMVQDPLRDDALVTRMVEGDVVWVPTLELFNGYDLPDTVPNLARFVAAGGKVALGTDFRGAPVPFQDGMPLLEMELMRRAGMSPEAILVAATRNAARVCGRELELGTLEAGKRADILVVSGDPTRDLGVLARPLVVLRDGVVVGE